MLLAWLPIFVFLFAYTVLCGVGSVLLFWHVGQFPAIYHYFSGVALPQFSSDERTVFLLILFGGPLCLVVGYGLMRALLKRWNISVKLSEGAELPTVAAHVLFYLFFSAALSSLHAGGAFSNLATWFNYSAWVNSRWSLYHTLSFFEFVNVYKWLPTLAALVLLMPAKATVARIMRWLPLLLTLGVNVCLYQKTPFLFTLLLGGGVLLLRPILQNPARFRRYVLITGMLMVSICFFYFLVVLIPYLGQTSKKLTSVSHADDVKVVFETTATNQVSDQTKASLHALVANSTKPSHIVDKPVEEITEKTLSPLSYAAFTLISRTPGPVLFYPLVFPKKVPYFPLDLGQDILGFGSMPTDSHVVWHAMYPDMEGGALAPINFVFYSQGGVHVALFGMMLVGAFISLCWFLILNSQGGLNTRVLLGVTLLLFMIHTSFDSLRNTVIVSYGFAWSVLLIWSLYLLAFYLDKRKTSSMPADEMMPV